MDQVELSLDERFAERTTGGPRFSACGTSARIALAVMCGTFFFFLPPAIPAVLYSVAIDTTTANHISTTRFVSDCTMGPLFCGITLREEYRWEPRAYLIGALAG